MASRGLVVEVNTWPMPPVASTTARPSAAPTPSRDPSPMTCRLTPQAGPGRPSGSGAPVSTSRTSACSITSMPGSSRTASRAATSAREISAPVASPPACTIRSAWWPPSRVSSTSPSAPVSKCAPSAIRSWIRAGPSVTSARTASSSHRPAPATSVSCRCASGLSVSASAAATPPCAHSVEPLDSTVLVTSSTRGTRRRRRSAVVRPAMPEPTTMTSASAVHPGAGATSRRATRSGRPVRSPPGHRAPEDFSPKPSGTCPASCPTSTTWLRESTKTTWVPCSRASRSSTSA